MKLHELLNHCEDIYFDNKTNVLERITSEELTIIVEEILDTLSKREILKYSSSTEHIEKM